MLSVQKQTCTCANTKLFHEPAHYKAMLTYTHITLTRLHNHKPSNRVFPNNKHSGKNITNIKLYIKLSTSTCLVALIEDIQTPGSMYCSLMYFKDNFNKVEILRSLNVQRELASKSGKVICRACKLKQCAFHPPFPLLSTVKQYLQSEKSPEFKIIFHLPLDFSLSL